MSAFYIARSSAVAARRLGDEYVVMSAVDSTLYTLNEVGAVLWEAADGRTPLAEIVARKICAQFAVDADTALRDAEEFSRSLAQRGILLISSAPILPPAEEQVSRAAAVAAEQVP